MPRAPLGARGHRAPVPAASSTRSARPSAGAVPASPGAISRTGSNSLLDRFRSNGQGEKANSWVSADANRDLDDGDLEGAIGGDTLDELAQKTGLSREELVRRLKTALPETVNRLTPGGRVPSESEAQSLI